MDWPWLRHRGPTLEDLVTPLQESVTALDEQITKLSRLQYKGTHQVLEALNQLAETVQTETAASQAQFERTVTMVTAEQGRWTGRLLTWLDSLDALSRQPDSRLGAWFDQWRVEVIEALAELGLEEVAVADRLFDPHTAESLGTVGPDHPRFAGLETVPEPYWVVEVLRRGFRKADHMVRKAHVITMEGRNYGDNTECAPSDRGD